MKLQTTVQMPHYIEGPKDNYATIIEEWSFNIATNCKRIGGEV